MTWTILLVGAIGLAIAAYGFVSLTVSAMRRRQYVDIVLAVLVAIVVVVALIAFGDRLVQ